MNLPVGVYAVSESFAESAGKVYFTFRETYYEAQMGINAFSNMDDVTHAPLQKVKAPFWGYEDVAVVLVPAGELWLGKSPVRDEKFRTYFPCAVAVLGENVGISPNEADLRTPAARREESVLRGSFYFGCLAMEGEVDGSFVVDGITLEAKIFDERTGGKNVSFAVKNTRICSALAYNIFWTQPFCGERSTRITDCRAVGVHSRDGEGRLINVESGSLTVERIYVANTRKFLGLCDHSKSYVNRLTELTVRDCLFENSGSTHGLTVNLPENSTAKLCIDHCQFLNFTPEEDPAVTVTLPKTASLTVKNSRFAGSSLVPAILVDGDAEGVQLEACTVEGFQAICAQKSERRTCPDNTGSYRITDAHTPVEGDFARLEALYQGRQLYFGDFHCHSNSGGTSDGRTPIETFAEEMKKKQLDFAAIVDHKQMRHFFLPCWDETCMICGTEPGHRLTDPERSEYARNMDYTMIFPDKTGLAQVLEAFPQFQYTGGWDGHYKYHSWSMAELRKLADYVYGIGGLLTHAHPKQLMSSEDPMDYYVSDLVPLETVHVDPNAFSTKQNRDLWEALLKLGKRVRTHGSSDSHGDVSNRGLTAVYTEKRCSTDFFNAVRSGDCTAGGVGIRMCIGDTPMGGVAEYRPGQLLLVKVDRFHPAHKLENTVFCLKVYTDKGLAYAREFDCEQPQALVLPVQKRLYYRVEITNESDGLPVAFSNPVWLD